LRRRNERRVAPYAGARIETSIGRPSRARPTSPLTQGRGSKPFHTGARTADGEVAPYAGARIETQPVMEPPRKDWSPLTQGRGSKLHAPLTQGHGWIHVALRMCEYPNSRFSSTQRNKNARAEGA